MKIEISLENARIAPIERTPELGSILFGIGRGLMNACPPTSLPGGVVMIKGRPEASTVTVRVSDADSARPTTDGGAILRVEIDLDAVDPFTFAPGIEVQAILQAIGGDLMHRLTDHEPDSGDIRDRTGGILGSWEVVKVAPSARRARRERLRSRIVWTGLPGSPGYSCLHARLDVPMDDRGFMTRGEWFRDDDLTPEKFWASVERVEKRILDAAEALADRLS
jgi:hypothetical protein